MNTNPTTRHADTAMTLDDMKDLACKCGVGVAFPYLRDVLVYGKRSAVRRMLVCMGLGFDTARRGLVQGLYDGNGRQWGEITYADDGRAGARLDYLLASA